MTMAMTSPMVGTENTVTIWEQPFDLTQRLLDLRAEHQELYVLISLQVPCSFCRHILNGMPIDKLVGILHYRMVDQTEYEGNFSHWMVIFCKFRCWFALVNWLTKLWRLELHDELFMVETFPIPVQYDLSRWWGTGDWNCPVNQFMNCGLTDLTHPQWYPLVESHCKQWQHQVSFPSHESVLILKFVTYWTINKLIKFLTDGLCRSFPAQKVMQLNAANDTRVVNFLKNKSHNRLNSGYVNARFWDNN